jgi:pyruvate, water dikinase
MKWIRWFNEIGIDDVPAVGGKNASLGEMLSALQVTGVRIPQGFAVTAAAYHYFLQENDLDATIRDLLNGWQRGNVQDLANRSKRIRAVILNGEFPTDLRDEIVEAYNVLSGEFQTDALDVAVRSSATAEDLPTASFAGQQESFLHIHGEAEVLDSIKRCMASLFTGRAINYREDMGFDHFKVGLSVGVQAMVRADDASSGVIFTLDTESGFRDVVFITAIWGLGENIVQGRVGPDEFYVHKPTLAQGYSPLISKQLGSKELRMRYDTTRHRLANLPVPTEERERFALTDAEVLELARWGMAIEEHYTRKRGTPTPMDIEWAKDSRTGELFIVQARPETVHSQPRTTLLIHHLETTAQPLVEGLAIGEAVATGKARVIQDPREMRLFQGGEILVTEITNPDWEPILKIAAGVVTERGGRTSHAAIVARELGIPAVVGAANATRLIPSEKMVTLSCCEGAVGRVYADALAHSVEEIDVTATATNGTAIMMNVGNPEQAFKLAQIPNDGVGLARMEFIFASAVQIHPLALTRYARLSFQDQREVDRLTQGYADKTEYFVDKLSQGIATIAAAFWPKPVILRFSDFKTNEYAHLIGGAQWEPHEENPMLGWRGASRYYHPDYREGFMLEVAAVKRVREQFGLKNLVPMIPFCRTPEEGQKVLDVMRDGGLQRGMDGLQVYVMAELPSNVLLAEEFAAIFDGFSIGSNDLTQLTLGVDRDSERIASLFDERNEGVKRAIEQLIQTAHGCGRKVGICGQAPSDYPEFVTFLVGLGIDSISLSPDAVVRTRMRVLEAEQMAARQNGNLQAIPG